MARRLRLHAARQHLPDRHRRGAGRGRRLRPRLTANPAIRSGRQFAKSRPIDHAGHSGTVGSIAGLAMIVSAAGACAQQTEQLSLPNVTVTAPAAAPAVAPYLRDPGKPTSEILIMVGIASRRTDFARSRVRRPASPLPREANASRGLWGEQGSEAHDLLAPVYGWF